VGGEKYFYHFDRLGNVVGVTDAEGQVARVYSQSAFGYFAQAFDGSGYANAAADPQPYHLTTKEFDPDVGLYYFNARWYDPIAGRWIGRDTIGDVEANPYEFCFGSPANATDTDGERSWWHRAGLTVLEFYRAAWGLDKRRKAGESWWCCFESCQKQFGLKGVVGGFVGSGALLILPAFLKRLVPWGKGGRPFGTSDGVIGALLRKRVEYLGRLFGKLSRIGAIVPHAGRAAGATLGATGTLGWMFESFAIGYGAGTAGRCALSCR
jgi:RHS repeat-associated protein